MANKILTRIKSISLVNKFLESELTGADLARNPEADLDVAKIAQGELNRHITAGENVAGLNEIKGSLFEGTSFLSSFHSEQQRLRREFVDATVEERFGRQGVTSVSSTVNAQGVRTPIGGRGVGTTPTGAQRNAIAAEFRTPLVSIAGSRFVPSQAPQRRTAVANSSLANQSQTIISGAGFARSRGSITSKAPTILTSDSDAPQGKRRDTLGSPTILG